VYALTDGDRYYIGESINVAFRFAQHSDEYAKVKQHDLYKPWGFLLAEVRAVPGGFSANKKRRLKAELRFIAAAKTLELPLVNKHISAGISQEAGLEYEIDRLNQVVSEVGQKTFTR